MKMRIFGGVARIAELPDGKSQRHDALGSGARLSSFANRIHPRARSASGPAAKVADRAARPSALEVERIKAEVQLRMQKYFGSSRLQGRAGPSCSAEAGLAAPSVVPAGSSLERRPARLQARLDRLHGVQPGQSLQERQADLEARLDKLRGVRCGTLDERHQDLLARLKALDREIPPR